MNEIRFKLSDDQCIKIFRLCKEDHLYSFDEIKIVLFSIDQEYLLLKNDYLRYGLEMLKTLLSKAIENNLILPRSISGDIGYIWNEYIQSESRDVFEHKDIGQDQKIWVGVSHELWESPEFATWLYNKNEKIIFEITPLYKWHSMDSEQGDNDYISYDEFIKNYKPTLIIEIPRETAQQWLKQTEDILKEIEKTDKEVLAQENAH